MAEIERRTLDGKRIVEQVSSRTWEDTQRPRSYSASFAFYATSLASIILWVTFWGMLVALAGIFLGWEGPWKTVAPVCLLAFIILLIGVLDFSHKLSCPLCHGTPLLSRKCNRHRLAVRWPLFSYRATTVLSAVLTLRFRCQYCSTPYRLFKKSGSGR